jgi:hypothetical protein
LALAGAALIPGFLHFQMKPAKVATIRATGALAVFVVVYFLNPAKLLVEPPSTEELKRAASDGAEQGVRESAPEIARQVAKELRTYDATSNTELTKRYPGSYILLGIADGKIIYEPRLMAVEFHGDWDNSTVRIEGDVAEVVLKDVTITSSNAHFRSAKISQHFKFKENEPLPFSAVNLHGRLIRFEVLDAKGKIFVIGFQ